MSLCVVAAESGSTVPSQHSGTTSPDLFESQHSGGTSGKQSTARKTPESFLGPNAALVNLDSLVSKPPQPVTSLNPFLAPGWFLYNPSRFCLSFPFLQGNSAQLGAAGVMDGWFGLGFVGYFSQQVMSKSRRVSGGHPGLTQHSDSP